MDHIAPFYNRTNLLRYTTFIGVVILIIVAYLLTPRYWEPSGESWRYWAAARILAETGKFPVFSVGPLYVVYLLFFRIFEYPLSMQLEYAVTHLFAYIAIFLMLRTRLPNLLAFLLTCAWIPALAMTEGGEAVAGIGFLALYLAGNRYPSLNRGYLPSSLLAAALCHSAYVPFLLAHIFGKFLERRILKRPLIARLNLKGASNIFALVIKTALLILVFLALFLQSPRWDNNHMFMDPTYSPVPLKNPLTIGFFQLANFRYVIENTPEPTWKEQDWYLTNKEAFGGATSIPQAFLRNPAMAASFIMGNIRSGVKLPRYLIAGECRGKLITVFWIFVFVFGFFGFFNSLVAKGSIAVGISVLFGASAVTAALVLTHFQDRYIMLLLPVGLMVVAYAGRGFFRLLQPLRRKEAIAAPRYITCIVVLLSALMVFASAYYPSGGFRQVEAVLKNQGLLKKDEAVSMASAYPQLLQSIDRDSRVLALEDQWIKGFTDTDLDNIYNVFGLPPFADTTGKTEEMLKGFDMIWVSSAFSEKQVAVSTSYYLRYQLHVEPFLKKVLTKGWDIEEVDRYGKIYSRRDTRAAERD